MRLVRALGSFALLIALAAVASAQDKKAADDLPALLTATGLVDKADKESLSVKPRGADGKFQKTLVLKVTGTSKVAVLAPQKRGDKTVLTQREADAKDLVTGQTVAVVYAEAGKDGAVLLTAVAHPAK
ncbi:hypothetical protein [Frigoriglobus tundricola]|uniref:DUF5666 domain-containing protein n=1 Tax=Frigoriglobus tundricola TaxID=2774151 RepID=A0A6M5YYD9_9BACT|nr:hypothetical protein [Frigoriglobus tundricola]QJW98223.1 hypothetical protein FTUN_5807 [Frigoriglobus tundricola]